MELVVSSLFLFEFVSVVVWLFLRVVRCRCGGFRFVVVVFDGSCRKGDRRGWDAGGQFGVVVSGGNFLVGSRLTVAEALVTGTEHGS